MKGILQEVRVASSDANTPEGVTLNYYKAILQNLFFATLNTDDTDTRTPRKFRTETEGARYKGNIGIANVYRYKSAFINPQETLEKYFLNVPFLNGGLFECLDKPDEKIWIDGFSERKDNPLDIPDDLFFCEPCEVDLNSIYDTKNKKYEVRGLINILDNYKFTIAENTPIEEEIALDPELLGKVFENLLANYNPETKTTARKQTGSFYTPREIVNYMVDESLIAYFKSKVSSPESKVEESVFIHPKNVQGDFFTQQNSLNLTAESPKDSGDDEVEAKLRDLFSYSGYEHQFNDAEINVIVKAINDCKILDPACGSGAFPMGILQRLVFLLGKLDPNNVKWRELQRRVALKETDEAFKNNDSKERENRLLEINEVFENNASDYGRKLFLIENCIYGVDIQPVAIQISKLRFFISLIIDQKVQSPNFSLKTPRFAGGRHDESWTLNNNRGIRPLPNLETKLVAANTLIGLDAQRGLKPEKVHELEENLKPVRSEIFRARTTATKTKWRERDKEIRREIAELLKQTGFAPDDADKIADWSPDNQDAHADWFDAEWMFGIEKGFDIVIGNPPYVQVSKGLYSVSRFPYSEKKDKGKQNLYKVFVETSYNLAKENGIASMIVQSSLMCDISAQFTRQLLLTKTELKKVIEFPKVAPTKEGQVFESVLQGTCVYVFCKAIPNLKQKFALSINNDVTTVSKMQFDFLLQTKLMSIYPNGFFIPLVKPKDFDLAQKIFNQSTLLETKISRIKKGDISSDGGKRLFDGVMNGFRLIRGNNIQRFHLKSPFDRVIKNNSTELLASQNSFENVIAFQNITGTVDKHRIHCSLFENENDLIFLDTTIKIFLKANQNAKFILGVLNCRISDWYFRKTSTNNHVNGYEIEQLPIPKATEAQQTEIAEIVEKILAAKKANPQAETSAWEREIDKLVYGLYELTADEIAIVEGVGK